MKTYKQFISERKIGNSKTILKWISHEGDLIDVEDMGRFHDEVFIKYMKENYPDIINQYDDIEDGDEVYVKKIAKDIGWIHLTSIIRDDNTQLMIDVSEPKKDAAVRLKKYMEENPHDQYDVMLENSPIKTFRTPREVISAII